MRGLQDSADLEQRRADLQKRRQTPAPVAFDLNGLDGDGSGNDRSDEVRRVEEGGQERTLLRVAEFTNQGGSRNDAEDDAHAEQHTSDNVHGD